jgi:hypothetical protein
MTFKAFFLIVTSVMTTGTSRKVFGKARLRIAGVTKHQSTTPYLEGTRFTATISTFLAHCCIGTIVTDVLFSADTHHGTATVLFRTTPAKVSFRHVVRHTFSNKMRW